MSMIAKFVQVAPGLMNELLEDPDRVPELFIDAPVAMRAAQSMTAQMRERAMNMGPQALAAILGRLDPRVRERLEQRLTGLGIDPRELAQGGGADKLAQLLERTRAASAALLAQAPAGTARGKGGGISLEKAWHGVHYLLCGQAVPGADLLSQAIMGGTEIGDDDSGYGPARYFSARQVAAIASELARPTLEDEMKARFDAKRMDALELYPGGWDQPDAMDWLLHEFRNLRKFFTEASAGGFAVVTCLE